MRFALDAGVGTGRGLKRLRKRRADVALRHEIRECEQYAGENKDQQQRAESQTLDATEDAHGKVA